MYIFRYMVDTVLVYTLLVATLWPFMNYPRIEILELRRELNSIPNRVCHSDVVWWVTRTVSQYCTATCKYPSQGDSIEEILATANITLETGASILRTERLMMPCDDGDDIDLYTCYKVPLKLSCKCYTLLVASLWLFLLTVVVSSRRFWTASAQTAAMTQLTDALRCITSVRPGLMLPLMLPQLLPPPPPPPLLLLLPVLLQADKGLIYMSMQTSNFNRFLIDFQLIIKHLGRFNRITT